MSEQFDEDVVNRAAAEGLADDDAPDFATPVQLPEVDRTELEIYGEVCPAQARFIETGRVIRTSKPLLVGQEAHEAYSAGVAELFQVDPMLRDWEVAQEIENAASWRLLHSRPDLQPEIVKACEPSLKIWSRKIAEIAAVNVLAYDGAKRGTDYYAQFGWDIPALGVCFTTELDFLFKGPSPAILHEYDWKTGHESWPEQRVYESFQFQSHAVVVLERFQAEALDVAIFKSRERSFTKPVRFERKYLEQYKARIYNAAVVRNRNKDLPPEKAEAWPSEEGCRLCPARAMCPHVPASEIDKDPVAYVLGMHALQQKLEGMAEEAASYVERTGQDIVTSDEPNAIRFGVGRPIQRKAPTPELYTLEKMVPSPKVPAKSKRGKKAEAAEEAESPEPAEIDVAAIAEIDAALLGIGATFKARSPAGSRYYNLSMSTVRVSNHDANEKTEEWIENQSVMEIRVDQPNWREQLEAIVWPFKETENFPMRNKIGNDGKKTLKLDADETRCLTRGEAICDEIEKMSTNAEHVANAKAAKEALAKVVADHAKQ